MVCRDTGKLPVRRACRADNRPPRPPTRVNLVKNQIKSLAIIVSINSNRGYEKASVGDFGPMSTPIVCPTHTLP